MPATITPDVVEANRTHDLYCHDVLYTPHKHNPNKLLTDDTDDLIYRMCCAVQKNGKALVGFAISQQPVNMQLHSGNRPLHLKLSCYRDETFSGVDVIGSGNSSIIVKRGEQLYCQVIADTWDVKLLLVVDHCYFSPDGGTDTITYSFIENRCATTDNLGLLFYPGLHHIWGFRFTVPKFQGFDSLHLTCSAYLCNQGVESKIRCDRSCPSSQSLPPHLPTRPPRRHTKDLQDKQDPNSEITGRVDSGHLTVADEGFGPVIDLKGHLYNVPKPADSMSGTTNVLGIKEALGLTSAGTVSHLSAVLPIYLSLFIELLRR